MEQIMQRYAIDEVIVTYGAAGAIYHAKRTGVSYHFAAYQVDVKDTIGSGDSFLAAFLSKRMRNQVDISIEETMGFAATLSAFVTQSTGACPSYDASTIKRFEWIHYLGRGRLIQVKKKIDLTYILINANYKQLKFTKL
ncbi:PfkB family carbohydrate kinase [Sphingobacterium sp. KU25419]|nr:PfkB family carbohydrate kinase [Sphingobacterium sp. KU25419]